MITENLERAQRLFGDREGTEAITTTISKSSRTARKVDETKAKKKEVEKYLYIAWKKYLDRTNGRKEDFFKQDDKYEDLIRNYFHDELKNKKRTPFQQFMLIIDRNRR